MGYCVGESDVVGGLLGSCGSECYYAGWHGGGNIDVDGELIETLYIGHSIIDLQIDVVICIE